jgi:KUP system potassium uptake protein
MNRGSKLPTASSSCRLARASSASSSISASWPDIMEGLKLACRLPELQGIDPENITYYFRRVMVIACDQPSGMAVWRKSLFAMMHLNANLPAAYFGVPPSQVVEVGLEVEI